MHSLVDCVLEDERWQALDLPTLAASAAEHTLRDRGLDPAGFEICVMGCDDARIAALNADFRDKAKPTNVLSWPSDERGAEAEGAEPESPEGDAESPEELGDIAIAWETCEREAAEQGKPMRDHVYHLVVHAVLHLLGYDHERDGDAALMEATEIRICAGFGLANPYE